MQPEKEIIDDVPMELTWDDCLQWLGNKAPLFFERRNSGQRIGQAWFNVLSVDDQDKLRGTIHDPFYKDTKVWVIEALRYLLES